MDMDDRFVKQSIINSASVFDRRVNHQNKTFKNDDDNQSTGYFYICGELSKPHLLLLKRLKSH